MKTNPIQVFKIFITLLSILVFTAGYSQNKSTVLSKPSRDTGISTGKVIAYNKEISPPYFVEQTDNKVLINKIQYYPKLKDPARMTKPLKISNVTLQKFNLTHQLDSCYFSNIQTMDETTAADDLIYKFDQGKIKFSSVAKSLSYKNHSIIIQYNDGKSETMVLSSYGRSALKNETQCDQKRVENEYNKVVRMLKSGWTLCFDYKKTDFLPKHK